MAAIRSHFMCVRKEDFVWPGDYALSDVNFRKDLRPERECERAHALLRSACGDFEMDHIQTVVQGVRKRSRQNGGVERCSGGGDHSRLAVPGVVEPAEEPLLLFTI